MTATELLPLDLPRLIRASTIAEALQVSLGTVRDMARRGVLPTPITPGRRWQKYDTSAVRTAVAKMLEGATHGQ